MKKTMCSAIALIGGLCASTAMAQSSVTVYGLVDTGVVYTTNANAAGNSITKMPSLTSSFPSRIGFRGVEDLGNGLQALFVLENGFGLDNGTIGQGGRLFGRQANVGLKGAFGTLTLGRQINMTYLSGMKSDVMGPHLFSIGSIDGYLPNSRSDNAIGYLGTFNEFTVGATYSFGRDTSTAGGPAATGCAGEVAGNSKACRQITGLVAYDTKGFGINATYDVMYGNAGAAGGLATSDNSDKRATINAYAMLGDVKIGGGVIDRKLRGTPSLAVPVAVLDSDLYYLGASYPVSPAVVVDAQVARRDIENSADDVTLLVARVTYNLSKRTAVYSSIGHIKNGGNSAVAIDAGGTVGLGKNQTGLMAGLRHNF